MKTKNIFIIGVVVIAGFAACTKDDTITPVETIKRTDYVGSWACTEVPVAKNLNFDCIISLDPSTESNIKISNFASLNSNAFAIVNGKSLILPRQTINNNTVEGYGTMDNNKNFITWNYYVVDNTDSTVYNTTFNRK